MRHVSMTELQDKAVEVAAAAAAGEQVALLLEGRTFQLVPIDETRAAQRRAGVEELFRLGQEIRATNGPTTAAEIRNWIEDGRA